MGSLAVVRAARADRRQQLLVLAGLVLWLVYTRMFWTLKAAHVTLPPCPFLAVTGHPCPFCGGTRSFAAMWDGNPVGSYHWYLLGPVLFVGTLVGVAALALMLLSGRAIAWRPAPHVQRRLYVLGGAVLVSAWAWKLAFSPVV